jgi:LPS-assembly lipoprotein
MKILSEIPAQAGIQKRGNGPQLSLGFQTAFIFLALFLLSACGFRPLYSGTNTLAGGTSVHDAIWIDQIPDADGLNLRNALIDRFYHNGTPEHPAYVLKIVLTRNSRDLAIRKNDTTTRAQIVYRADYTLTDRAANEIIDSGSIRAIGSYNILESQYTTIVTQETASRQALEEMADKLTLRLGVVLEKKTSSP